MKEFSVEIKAKFYDEAIKRAKELAIDGYLDAVAVNEIFPELEEPDGERIRKRIIHALHGDVLDIEETKEAIDWLKRQGEQRFDVDTKVIIPRWIIFIGKDCVEQNLIDKLKEK